MSDTPETIADYWRRFETDMAANLAKGSVVIPDTLYTREELIERDVERLEGRYRFLKDRDRPTGQWPDEHRSIEHIFSGEPGQWE